MHWKTSYLQKGVVKAGKGWLEGEGELERGRSAVHSGKKEGGEVTGSPVSIPRASSFDSSPNSSSISSSIPSASGSSTA
jgi:hypothetical protein